MSGILNSKSTKENHVIMLCDNVKSDVVVHICHPRSQPVETGRPGIQLHSHFEARLDCMKPYLTIKWRERRREKEKKRRQGKRKGEGRAGERQREKLTLFLN